jgi:DNA-binding IclR family transcriptional regulator
MEQDKPAKLVRSVERTLMILFCVASARKPLGLSEISAATNVDKATALRLLSTLEAFRLVKRDDTSRKYAVGSGVWQLSKSYQIDLRNVAQPYLRSLRDTTGESVSLMVERGLERVVLMAIEASHELRVVPALNSVVPIYSGASGKVFMAFMPEAERDRIIEVTGLKPVNERGLTDRKSFLKALEQVRKDGYAVTVGDVTLGAVAVAAPIFGRADVLQGVVSVRGPEARMTSERVKLLAPLVVETADAISREVIGAMTPDDSR